ncbi:hypothetical protein BST36_27320 [Mycolicibacterium moriokaense]|uniref:Uncharacterized protein n=1 Tax=Mycolicibacterium moriokaense TaxID=39691 RepID=A0AAD1M888_9MYCO|nr:DUF5994 family protein [Mycolicibacterium moriokaense]MCV7038935.1 hypothetical protein [Mycolicibacterium moriokaense]ORB15289.1 hypothetical protein BST36_27320 [Mycolicibacterium moriokaense]BBX04682.1 hypothetical protein MMOR_56180 [Mycolicibacterium moriokaense]
MNGLSGTRRVARPVRLLLARQLGADIDGAWWPHSASVASELPELIGVLHAPLGEIVDIGINWSPTEGPVDLESIVTGARVIDRPGPRRPRLMMVEGRTACAKLLVVPYMTSQNLGATVMRCAAGLSASLEERDSKLWDLAHSLMGIAKAESAVWSGRLGAEDAVL